MKKTTKELLDDLLEDGAPAEFQAALLDKTFRSARRRKRVRRFNMTLSVMALAGICVFSFWKMREPGNGPMQIRQEDELVVNSQPGLLLPPGEVVNTRASSVKEFMTTAPAYAEVVTTGSSGRYREIDDEQSLALLKDKTPIPVRQERAAQTIAVKGQGKGAVVSQIAFRPERARLKMQPNIRHLQCAAPGRVSRRKSTNKTGERLNRCRRARMRVKGV